jgi:hypothetical protein
MEKSQKNRREILQMEKSVKKIRPRPADSEIRIQRADFACQHCKALDPTGLFMESDKN